MYDWIVDNGFTPHVLVNAEYPGIVVPEQFVKDGQIVLNISTTAVRDLNLGNESVSFSARFSGTPMDVIIDPAAIMGIYAQENGRGMLFPEEQLEEGDDAVTDDEPDPTPPRPSLRVVK
jgi:stringent starvation protein B